MSLSTSIVTPRNAVKTVKPVRRDSLKIGDLFSTKENGRVFMHTGARTNPPSLGNNRGVIGHNSIVVSGKIKAGSDGAAYTTKSDKQVYPRGKAQIVADITA